jgi:hypothetical protein
MKLTQEEQTLLNALGANKKNFEIIYKYFIRPFETLPHEYKNVPNEQLGEIIKGQMLARENNIRYLMEMKSAVEKDGEVVTPIAPS